MLFCNLDLHTKIDAIKTKIKRGFKIESNFQNVNTDLCRAYLIFKIKDVEFKQKTCIPHIS